MIHFNIVHTVVTVVLAAGVVGFLVAERRQSRLGKWLCKPLASSAFIAAALASGAAATSYGRFVLAALVFSWLGDVLLIPKSTFLAGLGSFLVAHLLFAAAFVVRGVSWSSAALAAVVALLPVLPVSRWLLPHVAGKMRGPVIAYMTAISLMVTLAAGGYVAHPAPLALAGAVAFYLSDLSVARDRFVRPGFVNRLWGVPLYYAAQLLFAWSTAP